MGDKIKLFYEVSGLIGAQYGLLSDSKCMQTLFSIFA